MVIVRHMSFNCCDLFYSVVIDVHVLAFQDPQNDFTPIMY